MTTRALIFAIQSYPRADGLTSKQLEGTHAAGLNFYRWLTESRNVSPEDIWVNTDLDGFPGPDTRVRGATAADIRATFRDLVPSARGSTSVLLVFFSGHGFVRTDLQSGPSGPTRADILVASDFESLEMSGDACFRLDEIQQNLRTWLGPGVQCYFIDACRNECLSTQVAPTGLGLSFQPLPGDPGVFTLFSTQRGFAAATGSGFAGHLLDGLSGSGKAKRWDGENLGVYFDSLLAFMTKRMTDQKVQHKIEARGAALICEIDPIPTYTCTIEIEGAAETDFFNLTAIAVARRTQEERLFTGPQYPFRGQPDDYTMVLLNRGRPLNGQGINPVDLYEDQVVTFRLDQGAADSVLPGTATVTHEQRTERDVQIVSRVDPTVSFRVEGHGIEAPAGPYQVIVTDQRSGSVLASTDIDLPGSGEVSLDDVTGWPALDGAQLSLLEQLPDYAKGPEWVEFSESIGPIADDDLGVWLAILGASRIVKDPRGWEKIGHLAMFDTQSVPEGMAPLYVLTGVGTTDIRVSLWPDGRTVDAEPIAELQDLAQAEFSVGEGPKLLTVAVEGHPVRTIVSHCLPNRATLVTMTGAGGSAIRQHILPIDHLRNQLPEPVRSQVEEMILVGTPPGSVLDWVRFASQLQRTFATHAAVEPTGPDRDKWWELPTGNGLDPIMGLVAAYELLRSGDTGLASEAIGNLRRNYSELPDIEYLARRAGEPNEIPSTPPVILEGALGLGFTSFAGMPETHLDFTGPWTGWINARPNPGAAGDRPG